MSAELLPASFQSLKDTVADYSSRKISDEPEDLAVCCSGCKSHCLKAAFAQFWPMFVKSCIFKSVLELIGHRKIKLLVHQLKSCVPRFGLTCGLISVFFMLSMCALTRNESKLSKKRKIFIAAMISALPALIGFSSQEIRLIKLMMFPLVFRCIGTKLFEKGFPQMKRHGGIVAYVLLTNIIAFSYVLEPLSNAAGMQKSIESYTMVTPFYKM